MFVYAHLDERGVCIGFARFAQIIDNPMFVQIDNEDNDLLYRKYEDGEWSEEKYLPPEPEPDPSIEEQILFETQYQSLLLEMGMMF